MLVLLCALLPAALAEVPVEVGGALITTDATAVPSPTPQKTIFQMAKKN